MIKQVFILALVASLAYSVRVSSKTLAGHPGPDMATAGPDMHADADHCSHQFAFLQTLVKEVKDQVEDLWNDHIKGMFDNDGNFEGFGKPTREPCQCYGENEVVCQQTLNRFKIKQCLSRPECHWGPGQYARCADAEQQFRHAQEKSLGQISGLQELVNFLTGQIETLWNDHIKGMCDNVGVREPCQCFGENEVLCEQTGDRQNIRQCLSKPECHWGPGQYARCADAAQQFQHAHKQSLAQFDQLGAWLEQIQAKLGALLNEAGLVREPCKCYGPQLACNDSIDRQNIAQCLSKPECHWGPGQEKRCADAQQQFQHAHPKALGAANFENVKGHLKEIKDQLEDLWNDHIKGMFDANGNFEGFGVREPCQCFGENEVLCEQTGDRQNIRQCLSKPGCHWGPGQYARCAQEATNFTKLLAQSANRKAQKLALLQQQLQRESQL